MGQVLGGGTGVGCYTDRRKQRLHRCCLWQIERVAGMLPYRHRVVLVLAAVVQLRSLPASV
jgi:hypothetical protein